MGEILQKVCKFGSYKNQGHSCAKKIEISCLETGWYCFGGGDDDYDGEDYDDDDDDDDDDDGDNDGELDDLGVQIILTARLWLFYSMMMMIYI